MPSWQDTLVIPASEAGLSHQPHLQHWEQNILDHQFQTCRSCIDITNFIIGIPRPMLKPGRCRLSLLSYLLCQGPVCLVKPWLDVLSWLLCVWKKRCALNISSEEKHSLAVLKYSLSELVCQIHHSSVRKAFGMRWCFSGSWISLFKIHHSSMSRASGIHKYFPG